MSACRNCASTGYEIATHGWDAIRCTVCGGSGRMTIDVPVYGNAGEVDQIETHCVCQPPAPTDEDFVDATMPADLFA